MDTIISATKDKKTKILIIGELYSILLIHFLSIILLKI
jgi:hypothetical protein